jgi:hypothetical protein
MRPASPMRTMMGDNGTEIRLTHISRRAPLPGSGSIRSATELARKLLDAALRRLSS